MAKKIMPKEIYIIMEKDGEETYPIAYTSIDEIPESQHGKQVGCYDLNSVAELEVSKVLA